MNQEAPIMNLNGKLRFRRILEHDYRKRTHHILLNHTLERPCTKFFNVAKIGKLTHRRIAPLQGYISVF